MAISRRRRLLSILTVFLGVALLTTGCAKEEPKPTPTPTKTTIFSSEEAALQAAIDTYQKFNAAYFSVLAAGDSDYAEVEEFVTDDYFNLIESDTALADEGHHTEGIASFKSAEAISFKQSNKAATIKVRLCQDISAVQVLDANGNNVTDPSRAETIPMLVTFVWNPTQANFDVSKEEPWTGEKFCSE